MASDRVTLLKHFAKGLLFKPLGVPQAATEFSVGVDLKTSQPDAESYELELRLRIQAEGQYQLELAYAGQFAVPQLSQAELTRLLLVDAPQILFPFARNLIVETVRGAGFAPPAMETIDFAELHRRQKGDVPAAFARTLEAPGALRALFPTHLYSAPLGADLAEMLKTACLELAANDTAGQEWARANAYRGYTSYASVRDLPARAPVFAQLVTHLDRHAQSFAAAAEFDMRGKQLVLDTIWANVMEEGGIHTSHVHPHSAISGTYYVTTPDNAAAICFEDPRTGLMMSAPSRKPEARPESRAFVQVRPRAGSLLLWESWLRHGVEMQHGPQARISISFNYRVEEAR